MSFEKRVAFEAVRTLAFGGIGAAFAVLGTPLANPIRFISLSNLTDVAVTVTFDGTTDHLILPTLFTIVIDTNDFSNFDENALIRQGTQLSIKQTAGAAASGAFYASVGFTN